MKSMKQSWDRALSRMPRYERLIARTIARWTGAEPFWLKGGLRVWRNLPAPKGGGSALLAAMHEAAQRQALRKNGFRDDDVSVRVAR